MSLSHPNTPVSQQDLQDFYHKILPYIGGSSGGTGGGHTIEDAEGTDLTQRDTLQFGEGFKAEDDDTNQKTVITPDVMQSGDMSDIITPLPSVQPRYQKYSTDEQVVGTWIDGKPVYQKTFTGTTSSDYTDTAITHGLPIGIGLVVNGYVISDSAYIAVGFYNGSNFFSAFVNKTQIQLRAQQIYWNCPFVITIQYTKTTD